MASERVEQWLQDIRLLDEKRHRLLQDVRKMILGLGPDISEEVKYGGILFAAHQPFCGIFSYAKHATLEFSEGAALADPHGVLEGAGKFRRHIKLMSAADIQGKHLHEYLSQAFAAASAD